MIYLGRHIYTRHSLAVSNCLIIIMLKVDQIKQTKTDECFPHILILQSTTVGFETGFTFLRFIAVLLENSLRAFILANGVFARVEVGFALLETCQAFLRLWKMFLGTHFAADSIASSLRMFSFLEDFDM